MSQITLAFDNTLEFSDIIMPLLSSSPAEGGENVRPNVDRLQTSVFGIQVPLISINSTVIDFDAVTYFNLSCEGTVPTLSMVVEDRYKLITNIDKPRQDNEVRIQILPRFDDVYKKINMTFFISSISVTGPFVRLSCMYKVPSFISSRIESFGNVSTYDIFKIAAEGSQLGFASNIESTEDIRYMYCDNKSWKDLLESEIQYSGLDFQMLDWWVDYWNNINLVDIYERYTTIDSDDDMKIYVAGQVNEIGVDNDTEPQEVTATINDHPSYTNSELYVTDYSISNESGAQASNGTDKVYSIYEDYNDEYQDHLIQDGDIKNDIFTKYYYLGETYGEYNYLLQKEIRNGLLQKINSETIKVTLKSPIFGLMRGHKVNFMKYVNDDMVENRMRILEENGVIDRNIESNIPLQDYELDTNNTDGSFRLDKTVSGQYLIIGTNIIYDNGWKYVLTLARPANSIPNLINEEE